MTVPASWNAWTAIGSTWHAQAVISSVLCQSAELPLISHQKLRCPNTGLRVGQLCQFVSRANVPGPFARANFEDRQSSRVGVLAAVVFSQRYAVGECRHFTGCWAIA